MRRWLGMMLAAVLAAPACSPPQPPASNVLLVVVDDLATTVVGAYAPAAKTPNLDQLAARGVVFRRAYSQSPSCNPSRTTLLTGLRPDTSGVHTNEMRFDANVPNWATTIPELMKRRGYYTVALGKFFHREWEAAERVNAFDRLEFIEIPKGWNGTTTGLPASMVERLNELPPPRFRFSPDPQVEALMLELEREKDKVWERTEKGSAAWEAARVPFSETRANLFGDSGLEEIQEAEARRGVMAAYLVEQFAREKRPWFMALGFRQTHTPLLCPKTFLDLHDPAALPDPGAPRTRDVGIPAIAVRWYDNWDMFNRRWWGKLTPDVERDARRAYYACASFVDAQIGRVLNAIEHSGQADRTIVVVTSDHGFHLGEHGLWGKYSLFEQTTRVPLLVSAPGVTPEGAVSDAIVELVDLLPTLGELTGARAPERLEGTSFVPVLRDPARPWKSAAFSSFRTGGGEGRALRTRRWRYAEWTLDSRSVERELYDLETDPLEQRNLAGDPAHEERVAELAERLHAGWQDALPPRGGLVGALRDAWHAVWPGESEAL